MEYVKSFKELEVYTLSRNLSREIFKLSTVFPKAEAYSLTDQIRRSSRSIGAQIAEAWGKRSYEKHFLSKLSDADAEQLETQHWLETIIDCGYCPPEQVFDLVGKCESIGRMLWSMMDKSHLFCGGRKQ